MKRGRKIFSSIFPKFGSSFFDLNMSLGKSKARSLGLDLPGGPQSLSQQSKHPMRRVSCKLRICAHQVRGHPESEALGFRLGEIGRRSPQADSALGCSKPHAQPSWG